MYTIAYIPYTRDFENIHVVFADTPNDVVNFLVDRIGCYVDGAEYVEDGIIYDENDEPIEISIQDCMSWLDDNFQGDGSFGATALTIVKGRDILFQG